MYLVVAATFADLCRDQRLSIRLGGVEREVLRTGDDGDAAAKRKADELHEKAFDARQRIVEIIPTTIVGASALLAYVAECDSVWDPEWLETMHANLAEALPLLAA
jgi:hypothetical protein